ncbi:unnamed protein product [Peniophora sp. CBMAI 1063]|nr:unnamed protein product [Peniophora sp. CBMAI 1063]
MHHEHHASLLIDSFALQPSTSSRPPPSRAGSLLPELLSYIFTLYKDDISTRLSTRRPACLAESALAWASVTHVCRHWRSVAIDSTCLWTDIVFHCGRAWAEEMFRRSRTTPLTLDIHLPLHTSAKDDPKWLPCRLAAHTRRIQRLALRGSPVAIHAVLEHLTAPAPLLEDLRVKPTHYIFGEVPLKLPLTLFSGSTPRLRSVFVRYCALPPNWPLLRDLTALSVWFPKPFDSRAVTRCSSPFQNMEELLGTLDASPELETLILAHCLPHISDDERPCSPHVAHPRLTSINIQGAEQDSQYLLSCIAASQCTC